MTKWDLSQVFRLVQHSKSINVLHPINKPKKKNHMTTSLGAERNAALPLGRLIPSGRDREGGKVQEGEVRGRVGRGQAGRVCEAAEVGISVHETRLRQSGQKSP